MEEIKFGMEYNKLWKQEKAKLLDVTMVFELNNDLIEYDTKDINGNYFVLPNDNFIQLIFLGNKGIPFCTLRSYTEKKYMDYRNKIGEMFLIKRTFEPNNGLLK